MDGEVVRCALSVVTYTLAYDVQLNCYKFLKNWVWTVGSGEGAQPAIISAQLDTAEPLTSSVASNVNTAVRDCDRAAFSLQCDLFDDSDSDNDMSL